MRPTARRAFILALGVIGTLALHPLPASAIWYCGLGPSGKSCAEYPIVTHWVADTSGGYFDLAGTDADGTRLEPPSYGSYSGMTTDTYHPSEWEGLAFIDAVEGATGIPVYMYNYDSDAALSKVLPGLDKIQVIHNVLLPLPNMKSLFTFIFPPGWQPNQQYPIVLSGDGGGTSNNFMFTLEQTRYIATQVGNSTKDTGSTGLIAALSNTGGREALGWHRNALDDVARMLTSMQAYGVDHNRVVQFGGSRGGGTAVLWGENPAAGDYTSIGVFAMAPPSHGGFITQQGLASYQGLHGINEMFNDETADRYSHIPRLIDMNPAPMLKIPLDDDRPWYTDRPQEEYGSDRNRKSPSGYLSYLLNLSPVKGKPVVLSVGTHDAIIPYPMVLKLDRTLKNSLGLPHWGISHLTCLTLRTGHNADAVECPRTELDRFLIALYTGQPYTALEGRRYFKATDLGQHPQWTEVELPHQTTLPFSATVPYRLGARPPSGGELIQWATLAACGENGRRYTATLRNAAGAPVFTVSKTFGQGTTSDFDFNGVGEPDPECDVIRLDQQPGWSTLPSGTYTWTFTFQGQDVNPGNLSYRDASGGRPTVATTIIDPQQPSRPDAVFDPGGAITMGVDEVPGEP